MKRKLPIIAFIICLFIMGAVVTANAQNVRKDAAGNYIAITHADTSKATATGTTYSDAKGIVYPVMISKNGKLFVVRTSKTGKTYNFYLKP